MEQGFEVTSSKDYGRMHRQGSNVSLIESPPVPHRYTEDSEGSMDLDPSSLTRSHSDHHFWSFSKTSSPAFCSHSSCSLVHAPPTSLFPLIFSAKLPFLLSPSSHTVYQQLHPSLALAFFVHEVVVRYSATAKPILQHLEYRLLLKAKDDTVYFETDTNDACVASVYKKEYELFEIAVLRERKKKLLGVGGEVTPVNVRKMPVALKAAEGTSRI